MSRIYDSSYLTQRKAEKAVAGSFLTNISTAADGTQYRGARPMLGNQDSSILYAVRTGRMTEYTRFNTCIGISPGCPCDALNKSVNSANPAIPGPVSGIVFTVGSIIVSWSAPLSGVGPFSYMITPYLAGVALDPVYTSELSYRFTHLDEMQAYTFTVCAINFAGQGPVSVSTSFVAPPHELTTVLNGTGTIVDPVPSLVYIVNAGLDAIIRYVASANLGPTKGSRYMYLWACSVAQAWNWIARDARVSGVVDQWNWDTRVPLSDNDSIVWICGAVDYITKALVPTYQSIYNCPSTVMSAAQTAGQWNTWTTLWQTWFAYRAADGSVAASTAQPTTSANWNKTIVVDGVTVNNINSFPDPQQWTRLTVQGAMQKYATYSWDSVLSSCLSAQNEADIQASVAPVTGIARDDQVDDVMAITAALTDAQKVQAEFWANSASGVTPPPVFFMWLWKEYIRTLNMSCGTVIYSLLDLAVHMFEGARVTWRLKYAFMQDRPIQEIRRRFMGQTVQSWNGAIDGSQWTPYQAANFVTPPFPDFPSGHSHFSKGFALVMTKWFGTNIIKNNTVYDGQNLISPMFTSNQSAAFCDFVVDKGTSSVQPGVAPSSAVTLSYGTWEDVATAAGMSRLYGGIHTIDAHTSSQAVAVQVDGYINSTWNINFMGPLYAMTPIPAEPVEPVAEPVEPVAEPVEPVAEPVAEPVVEPVAEPVEPVAEPIEPVAEQ